MSLYQRKLRMGMIGGGVGAFIGAVHRLAANLDGQIELVCGALVAILINLNKLVRNYFLTPQECMVLIERNDRERGFITR